MIASSVSTSIGSQPSSFSGLVVLRRTTIRADCIDERADPARSTNRRLLALNFWIELSVLSATRGRADFNRAYPTKTFAGKRIARKAGYGTILALARLRRHQVTQHPLKTLAVAIVALPAGEISDMTPAEEQSSPVIL
jgi:hypothetical protein